MYPMAITAGNTFIIKPSERTPYTTELIIDLLVGEAQDWIPEIVEKTKKLTIGPGSENPDIGPTNNKALLANVERLVADGEKNGTLLLDGRNPVVEGYPNGNWIGASIIDGCDKGMACYDEEIFGPVMCIKRAANL